MVTWASGSDRFNNLMRGSEALIDHFFCFFLGPLIEQAATFGNNRHRGMTLVARLAQAPPSYVPAWNNSCLAYHHAFTSLQYVRSNLPAPVQVQCV